MIRRPHAWSAAALGILCVSAGGQEPAGSGPLSRDGPLGADAALADATASARERAHATTEELAARREQTAAVRSEWATHHSRLEEEVRDLRERVAALRRERDGRGQAADATQRGLEWMERDRDRLLEVCTEYWRGLGTRMSVAEAARWADRLERLDTRLDQTRGNQGLDRAMADLLEFSRARNESHFSGLTFPGTCLDGADTLCPGTFGIFGPLAYFAAGDRGPAGLVVNRQGSTRPALVEPGSEAAAAIRALIEGNAGVVPVDLTAGEALRNAPAGRRLTEHLRSGGVLMIPLLAIGLLAIILTGWKIATLRGVATRADAEVDDVLAALGRDAEDEARDAAGRVRGPLSSVLLEGVEYRNAPQEQLEEILHERVLASLPALDRHLGTLAVLGGVAPLMGLLGTVTGMIHTFQLVTRFGTGEPRLLSGGISEALVTTEVGLAIAVPVLLVHAYLSRRVHTIVGSLEHTAIRFVNGLRLQTGPAP